MAFLAKFLKILTPLTSKLGLCGNTGFIAGSIAGFFLELVDVINRGYHLSNFQEVLVDSLLLTAVAWLCVLFVLCVICHLTFASVAAPSLVNCFITCLLTTYVTNKLLLYRWAVPIGMLIGILVGLFLCRLNELLVPKKG